MIQIDIDMPEGCQKCKFFKKHIFVNGLDYSYSCMLGAKEFPMFNDVKEMIIVEN